MGDRLLERRAAQSLVAGLAPPLDRQIVETGLGEMMGDRFGLGLGGEQRVGRVAVQRQAAALEQALRRPRPGSTPLLEAHRRSLAVGRGAVDEQEVGFHEPIRKRGL